MQKCVWTCAQPWIWIDMCVDMCMCRVPTELCYEPLEEMVKVHEGMSNHMSIHISKHMSINPSAHMPAHISMHKFTHISLQMSKRVA